MGVSSSPARKPNPSSVSTSGGPVTRVERVDTGSAVSGVDATDICAPETPAVARLAVELGLHAVERRGFDEQRLPAQGDLGDPGLERYGGAGQRHALGEGVAHRLASHALRHSVDEGIRRCASRRSSWGTTAHPGRGTARSGRSTSASSGGTRSVKTSRSITTPSGASVIRHSPLSCCASRNDSCVTPASAGWYAPFSSTVATATSDSSTAPSLGETGWRSSGRSIVTLGLGLPRLSDRRGQEHPGDSQLAAGPGPEPARMKPSTICSGVAPGCGSSGGTGTRANRHPPRLAAPG